MARQIIDLKKIVREGSRVDSTERAAPKVASGGSMAKIEWSAHEYETRERGPYWFLFPGALALALVIFGILARSYFFIAFVVLAFAVWTMYRTRQPKLMTFVIAKAGITVGRRHYPFSELKSFWIFDKEDLRELSVETTKTVIPFIRIPLGDVDAEEIRKTLLVLLPEEEHEEYISDQITRSLGF